MVREERQIHMAMNGLIDSYAERVLSAHRILELANKACFLYFTQKPAEQAKLLRMVLSNCSVDRLSLYPTYRKPFDLIFERAKTKEWSALEDDFRTFLLMPACSRSIFQQFPV